MKRFLFAIGLSLASLTTFNSCTREYITNTYLPSRTFIYTLTPNSWSVSDNGRSILNTIDLPELTRHYLEQGIVSVSMSNDGEATYDILPATFVFDTGTESVPIAFSVNYTVGAVTIYGEDPIDDFIVPVPTGNVILKVSLTDADFVE